MDSFGELSKGVLNFLLLKEEEEEKKLKSLPIRIGTDGSIAERVSASLWIRVPTDEEGRTLLIVGGSCGGRRSREALLSSLKYKRALQEKSGTPPETYARDDPLDSSFHRSTAPKHCE